jgi:hypothetical protein
MVNKMIVVLSAMALIITGVGVASAYMPGMPGGMCATGDMIMIPMKVKTSFQKTTGGTTGGDSTLLLDGCEQYTGGFRPWGVWKGTKCAMKVQVIPPKCVAPAYGGPVAWGAPPALMPGGKLVSNIEKYSIKSPGCDPCVTPGLQYEMIKKQQVK